MSKIFKCKVISFAPTPFLVGNSLVCTKNLYTVPVLSLVQWFNTLYLPNLYCCDPSWCWWLVRWTFPRYTALSPHPATADGCHSIPPAQVRASDLMSLGCQEQCFGSGFRGLLNPDSDSKSGSGSRGLKKGQNWKMLNNLSFNWILLIRKSYIYEVILSFVQIVLRNSLDPDPDSRSFWIRIEIFCWIWIRWIWIRSTGQEITGTLSRYYGCTGRPVIKRLDIRINLQLGLYELRPETGKDKYAFVYCCFTLSKTKIFKSFRFQ